MVKPVPATSESVGGGTKRRTICAAKNRCSPLSRTITPARLGGVAELSVDMCPPTLRRSLPPHEPRIQELIQNLTQLERADGHGVDDLANRPLTVDGFEHVALLAGQVRFFAQALDGDGILIQHLV